MEEKLKLAIIEAVKKEYGISLNEVKLEVPPKKKLGDYCFGCFVLSKDTKKNPAEIALKLIDSLIDSDIIESVTATGPYLNIKISKSIYTELFNNLYLIKQDFLLNKKGNNKNIVIDYIGANVGKPMHIGHMCTPNQGQVLVNLYRKLGYNVIADSHIGDWGIIFGKLILAFKMWGDENKLKENAVDYLLELYIKITEESENDNSIEQKIRDEFKLLSEGNSKSVELWREFTKHSIEAMGIQLRRLNVKEDYNIGESFYEGLNLPKMENYPDLKYNMSSVVEELIEKGIAIKNNDNSVGIEFDKKLKIPSCILQKRDGTHGYLASDLAAIKYRMGSWNPEKIVYFLDSRQQLHLKQVFVIAKLSGWIGKTELFHASNGFISLKDGAMSTRKGRIIKLDKLLDEAEERAEKIILQKRDDIKGNELKELSKMIGIGAIKYGYLKKNRETDVIFDWDEFMSFEGNSGPYIQYAYVRARRILEKSNFLDSSFDKKDTNNKDLFSNSEEIELVKEILNYNKVLEDTVKTNSPHILCKYSYELTKSFNTFYNNVHILNEKDEGKKNIRLKLIEIFSEILKDSFNILGIDMPNKM